MNININIDLYKLYPIYLYVFVCVGVLVHMPERADEWLTVYADSKTQYSYHR